MGEIEEDVDEGAATKDLTIKDTLGRLEKASYSDPFLHTGAGRTWNIQEPRTGAARLPLDCFEV